MGEGLNNSVCVGYTLHFSFMFLLLCFLFFFGISNKRYKHTNFFAFTDGELFICWMPSCYLLLGFADDQITFFTGMFSLSLYRLLDSIVEPSQLCRFCQILSNDSGSLLFDDVLSHIVARHLLHGREDGRIELRIGSRSTAGCCTSHDVGMKAMGAQILTILSA